MRAGKQGSDSLPSSSAGEVGGGRKVEARRVGQEVDLQQRIVRLEAESLKIGMK